jgi:hypothetical protein
MENAEVKYVELWNDVENMEKKVSWNLKWCGKHGRNPSWIVKRYWK